ncbi:MAG TPA: hypothetical protein VN625_06760, partial [Desulfuromonadaceae bacterium]|nr:hypothetical protein [Desulfuromonadaceae bacterium]
MKLAKHTGNRWHYQLTTQEAEHLRLIVGCFPVGPRHAAKISNTDTDPKTLEREKLLNESLAEHRKELQRKAAALVAPNRFKAQKTNQV